MKKERKKELAVALVLILAFVLWTALVKVVDVQAIGPRASSVGFATLNRAFHSLTGVNLWLYTVTDWMGLVPIAVALGFGVLGLVQLALRKSIFKVDGSILALGVFYFTVIAVYVFFEFAVINYRPVLIEGRLEASYPSSTTMLVTCVMPTAIMQFNERIKNPALRRGIVWLCVAFIAFMVIGRLISGVHWISDIIGGALFSIGVVIAYGYAVKTLNSTNSREKFS